MIPLAVAELAELVGGRVEGADPAAAVEGPVVVDSRLALPGSVFVCVAGQHVDGHDHVADATTRGAVVSLAGRPVDGPAVIVDDPVAALGRLAGEVLRRVPGCTVVGVTGSSGKTSTKDLIAAMLDGRGSTVAPVGSFNNELGLPLTVLRVDAGTRYLVLEYSARGVGHIAHLCGIAPPAIGVVLNVGSAHLGGFGSREAIARAKGELVEALPSDGLAVLNADDLLVAAMRTRTPATAVSYGAADTADVRIDDLRLDEESRPRFRLRTSAGSAEVALRLRGAHHAHNAAAAAAVGLRLGLSLSEIVAGLSAAEPVSPHRMQVSRRADRVVVVDDTYNANPESVRAALDAVTGMRPRRPGRTWAVLGEMRELGSRSEELHAATGREAAARGIDELVVVGAGATAIADGARALPGWSGTVTMVADPAAAEALLLDAVQPGDVVLLKASNALGLWSVAAALVDAAPAGARR